MPGMQQGAQFNLMVVGYLLHYLTSLEKRTLGSKLSTKRDYTLVAELWVIFYSLWYPSPTFNVFFGEDVKSIWWVKYKNKIWNEGLAVQVRED